MSTTRSRLARFAAIALLALSPAVGAQVAQVKNTGCPGAAYPTMTPSKINQNTTVTFPTLPSTDIPFLVLGFSSGNPLLFNTPFTCVDKCGLYPALPAFAILQFPPATKNFTFQIPNDPTLFQRCFSVQTAAAIPSRGCLDLHGALSFCIGR